MRRLAFSVFLLASVLLCGCAARSHSTPNVAGELQQRTGHSPATIESGTTGLPAQAKLEDGLSEDEAVAIANDTQFGLAGYFFTRDVNRAWRVAERLEYGMVSINEGVFANEVIPFGGMKESGIGREGSKYGIEDYIHTKYALFGGLGT